jgi:hypothetical protein
MAMTATVFSFVPRRPRRGATLRRRLAALVLVSSGPAAQQPGDGQGDHHRQGEPEADPAGELVDLAPAGTGG